MKFTTVILGAFVALAAAAPSPQPEIFPVDARDVEHAKLEARQYCTKCNNGLRTCCGSGGCIGFTC